jgi:hypothetical protein
VCETITVCQRQLIADHTLQLLVVVQMQLLAHANVCLLHYITLNVLALSLPLLYYTTGEGCTIQNSIICANATVGENCNLNDCQIGTLYEVGAGTKAKAEAFTRSIQGY